MKKSTKYISIVLLVIALTAFIIIPKLISTKDKDSNTQNSKDTKNQPVLADGFVVKTSTLDNSIKTIGNIVANEEVELKSELSRKITGIYFNEGSAVSKGSLLFKLDDNDLSAQLEKLHLEKKLLEKSFERQKLLLEKNLSTIEEFDIISNNLEKINADIAILEIQIDKTNIRAPFSGIIGFRKASIGSYVTPGTILATIQDISKIKVDFSVPEKYIQDFSKGEEIVFKVDGYDDDFTGTIIAYEPKLDGDTRSLTLRAVCMNTKNRLFPGTFANVEFRLKQVNNAIMIPTNALIPKLKGQDVFVLRNGSAELSNVKTGIRTENKIQITEGLSEGDTILTTNILRLKPGAKVDLEKIE